MEDVKCQRCQTVNQFTVEQSGPHLKAVCDNCGRYIKFLKQDKILNMASDKIIHLRINVKKINKDWLYEGEKGTYLDCTVFYNEEQDEYESNGMITQSVPAKIYEKEKDVEKSKRTRGEILGNCKEFKKGGGNSESVPGSEKKTKKKEAEAENETEDDLPF